jgi:ribonucleotide reductase beta subunit family protein with ferritin-like domain
MRPRTRVELPAEPITLSQRRFAPFPIQDHEMMEIYTAQRKQEWFETEINFSHDYDSWQKLSIHEQFFFKNTLANFANADQIVLVNVNSQLSAEIQVPEIVWNLAFQAHMEVIHSITYNMAIDTVIKDPQEKEMLFRSIETNPVVQPKMQWSQEWLNSDVALSDRMVGWCCVEGLFFASSFASLFWARKRGILPGISQSNELISKDEALHVKLGSAIYRRCENKLSLQEVQDIIESAVDIECKFAEDGLAVDLIGMNAGMMKKHIESQADALLVLLGYDKMYNTVTPFDFMFEFGLQGKTNFFERHNPDYARTDNSQVKKIQVQFDDDF